MQSLLSAVAVDKLVAARPDHGLGIPRTALDRELAGQGMANVVSGALGGLPVAGVAVRSVANVSAGAVSRASTMLHGLWIVLAALLLVPVLDLIPLPALAALVMVVGIQMVSITHIRTVTRHREVVVYVVTLTESSSSASWRAWPSASAWPSRSPCTGSPAPGSPARSATGAKCCASVAN